MPSIVPRIAASLTATLEFLADPQVNRMIDDPAASNFAIGNPQELPLPRAWSPRSGALSSHALRGTPRPHYHMALDAKGAEGYRSAIAAMGIETDMRFAASERVDVTLEPSEAELDVVGRAIAAHDSQRNEMVDRILSDPRLLFQMARNCYTRMAGDPKPPATDTLPELVQAPGRPLAGQP